MAMSYRKISVREIVQDIEAGMERDRLLEKYRLAPENFETIPERLIEANLITHLQFSELMRPSESQMTRTFDETRKAIEELDCGTGREWQARRDSNPYLRRWRPVLYQLSY